MFKKILLTLGILVASLLPSTAYATSYPTQWTYSSVTNPNGPTVLTGVNNNLKVVGYWSANGIYTAVTSECSNGCAGWTNINYPGATSSLAEGMNTGTAENEASSRTIVGYYITTPGNTIGYYRLNGEGFISYSINGTELLGASHVQCADIKAWACHGQQIVNPDPLMVGYLTGPSPNKIYTVTQAFEYDATTKAVTVFSPPGAYSAVATGINGHACVVGYMTTGPSSNVTSWFYRYGTYFAINYPGASSTTAYGINWQGDIVGDFTDLSGNTHGFVIYQPQTSHPLYIPIDYPGATSTVVRAIQAHNDIVGSYVDASGMTHGFIGIPTTGKHNQGTAK